jgi:hypothetical protein
MWHGGKTAETTGSREKCRYLQDKRTLFESVMDDSESEIISELLRE